MTMFVKIINRFIAILLITSVSLLANADSLPWAFNGNRVEGYSIDLVSVDPSPGTPLVVGKEVEFKVTVSYSMTVASHGKVLMVFQDEKNHRAKDSEPFVSQEVNGGSGTLVLSDKITIPKGAKELRLFLPLVPDGLTETDGEVVVRWPIKKK